MAEFRWLLAAVGILVLLLVFWISRREPPAPSWFSTRLRALLPTSPAATQDPQQRDIRHESEAPDSLRRIVTIRLMAREKAGFPGEKLVLALRDAGLRHGKFDIFHRREAGDDGMVTFSVASLVEPGSFDLTRLKNDHYPGVSLFLIVPMCADALKAFDDMLSTARRLAQNLDGELLDEQGSRLSVQRERYLREEIIQLQRQDYLL